MLVKLNINHQVFKEIHILSISNSKVVINNTMFNWKHGGNTLINIQLPLDRSIDDPLKTDLIGLDILRKHCQLISRVMNGYLMLEKDLTLDIIILNPDDLYKAEIKICLYLSNKHIIDFEWSIKSKLYNDTSNDINNFIKNLTKFEIEDFVGFSPDFNIRLKANMIGCDPNMIVIDRLLTNEIPNTLIRTSDAENVLFLLLAFNALGRLNEIQMSYLIDILKNI